MDENTGQCLDMDMWDMDLCVRRAAEEEEEERQREDEERQDRGGQGELANGSPDDGTVSSLGGSHGYDDRAKDSDPDSAGAA